MFISQVKAVIGWQSVSLPLLHIRALIVLLLFNFTLMAQTGGTYDITHAVVAGGGATQSSAGTYSVGGTAGQAAAGAVSFGGTYQLRGGFWAWEALVPTSAAVSINGRVLTHNGYGIRNAQVFLTEPNGTRRTATTATFGFFNFENVSVGQTYILEVQSGRFLFAEPVLTISVYDEVTGLEFVAQSQ